MADQDTKSECVDDTETPNADAPAGVVDPDKASGGMSAGFPADSAGESTSAADAPSGGGS